MKRLLITLSAALVAATPAMAQHAGHDHHAPAAAADPHADHAGHGAAATDPHAGHQGHGAAPATPAAADPHAEHHDHSAHGPMAAPVAEEPHGDHGADSAPDPHAGHHGGHEPAPAASASPVGHQDHSMHEPMAAPAAADPHAGHHGGHGGVHQGHSAPQAPGAAEPPKGPPPAAAFQGPAHAADTVFNRATMEAARAELRKEHGAITTGMVLVDLLEARFREGREGYAWEAEAWYGGDIDRLQIKTEGEGDFGGALESLEAQALWRHAINPWFNLQLGVRHDIRPQPQRTHAVLGIEGLAPYWIEVEGALFLSDKGDLTARVEAEYDQRITQKLILQPRAELEFAAQDVPELHIGSGLSQLEAGLRLRYAFVPELAPYIGVNYERAIGDTADMARAHGEGVGGWAFVSGVRFWF